MHSGEQALGCTEHCQLTADSCQDASYAKMRNYSTTPLLPPSAKFSEEKTPEQLCTETGGIWAEIYLVPLVFQGLALLASSTKGIVHLIRDLKLTIGPLQGFPGQLRLISSYTKYAN